MCNKLPKIEIPRLEEIRAIQERRSFMLSPIEKIHDSSGRFEVILEDNPQVAFNKESRRIFELGIKNKWRWSAGGAGLSIKLQDGRMALLSLLRDYGAPTYPGHLTLGTGLSCDLDEWLNPFRLFRETAEEFVIKTTNGILYPNFEGNPFPNLNFRAIANDSSSLRDETRKQPLIPASTYFVSSLPEQKTVSVVYKNKIYTSDLKGLVLLDPGVNGIDILSVVVMEVDAKDWRSLRIFDGEVVGGGNVLNRDVIALELDPQTMKPGQIIGAWKSGNFYEQAKKSYPQTPVLKCVIKALENRG
jgi:hypothetical protein